MHKILFALTLTLAFCGCLAEPAPTSTAAQSMTRCGFQPCPFPDDYPSCASIGCPYAPSGTYDIWTPCSTELCWCGNPAERCDQYA